MTPEERDAIRQSPCAGPWAEIYANSLEILDDQALVEEIRRVVYNRPTTTEPVTKRDLVFAEVLSRWFNLIESERREE